VKGSPLYRDTLALCGVLLEELEPEPRYAMLRERLAKGALRLVDEVALALSGFDRLEQLEGADAELQALRAHLHLAFELQLLDEEAFLTLAEQADAVGRQVGGWLKKLRRQQGEAR
jgi:hypothetical protein